MLQWGVSSYLILSFHQSVNGAFARQTVDHHSPDLQGRIAEAHSTHVTGFDFTEHQLIWHLWTVYLYFDVILQLSVKEVKGNRFLEFGILWKRLHFSLRRGTIFKMLSHTRQDDCSKQSWEEPCTLSSSWVRPGSDFIMQ